MWLLSFTKGIAIPFLSAKRDISPNTFLSTFNIEVVGAPSCEYDRKKVVENQNIPSFKPQDINDLFISDLLRKIKETKHKTEAFLIGSHAGWTDLNGCHYDTVCSWWHCH